MDVLVKQTLLVQLDHLMDLERLGNHRGHHAKKLDSSVIVAVLLVSKDACKGADRSAAQRYGHTDKGNLLLAELFRLRGAAQEQRFLAGLRNDDRLSALHDSSGDSLSKLVARVPS